MPAVETGTEDDSEQFRQLVGEITALPDPAYSDLMTVVLLTDMPVLRRALMLAESARYKEVRAERGNANGTQLCS